MAFELDNCVGIMLLYLYGCKNCIHALAAEKDSWMLCSLLVLYVQKYLQLTIKLALLGTTLLMYILQYILYD